MWTDRRWLLGALDVVVIVAAVLCWIGPMKLVRSTVSLHGRVLGATRQQVLSGDYAGAEKVYKEVLELAPGPDNVAARRATESLGYIYYVQGLYSQALTPLSEWTQWEPEGCEPLRMLGVTYACLGHSPAHAVDMLTHVVARCEISDSQYAEVAGALALARCQLQDQHACGRLLQGITKIANGDPVKAASMVDRSLAEGLVPATRAVAFDILTGWHDAAAADVTHPAVVTPTLMVEKKVGQFLFQRADDTQDGVLRIQAADTCSAKCLPTVVQLESDLPFAQASAVAGRVVVITEAEARFSDPAEVAHLLSEDRADDNWARASVRMRGVPWSRWAVSKQVQDNAIEADVALHWKPAKLGMWLEIRHWRTYVVSLP